MFILKIYFNKYLREEDCDKIQHQNSGILSTALNRVDGHQ